MKYLYLLMSFCALSLTAPAQTQVVATASTSPAAKAAVELVASSSTKVVKGAPFSAEGINESVQVLADGNKISRTVTTKMYRDGEGRFRREGESTGFAPSAGFSTVNGSLIAAMGFQNSVSIFDPVENIRYTLYPTTKTANRIKILTNILAQTTISASGSGKTYSVMKTQPESAIGKGGAVTIANNLFVIDETKSESLGAKSIEGVQAEGSRTVTTIPAGKIGNERPIEITYEKWYSKELDLIVYSRHYDPRFGEQVYRLTNINRSEPDPSLFGIPSDYKIVNDPSTFYFSTKPKN